MLISPPPTRIHKPVKQPVGLNTFSVLRVDKSSWLQFAMCVIVLVWILIWVGYLNKLRNAHSLHILGFANCALQEIITNNDRPRKISCQSHFVF